MPLVEQELLTLPEHMSSPPVFSGARVTRSLVLYACFVYRCLYFLFWPLCCLFFFNIRILITPLVSLNSSMYWLGNITSWLPQIEIQKKHAYDERDDLSFQSFVVLFWIATFTIVYISQLNNPAQFCKYVLDVNDRHLVITKKHLHQRYIVYKLLTTFTNFITPLVSSTVIRRVWRYQRSNQRCRSKDIRTQLPHYKGKRDKQWPTNCYIKIEQYDTPQEKRRKVKQKARISSGARKCKKSLKIPMV